MASALWLIFCLVPLTHSQIIPNSFNIQPSIAPIGINSNTDNVVSLNNPTVPTSSNSSDVPIDLSQLLLKLIRLAKNLAHDQPPFPPHHRPFPDTVDNSLSSSDATSDDSSIWSSPMALIIDSGASDTALTDTDTPTQPQATQAFNIVYGVDNGNQGSNQVNLANPFPTFTATQQQPGSFAQSSSSFPLSSFSFGSSPVQPMQQPSMPQPSVFGSSFGMNQVNQQPFFTSSNSLMPMKTQDDNLPLTFNNQPSYGYGQWPHFGHWMHPWGHRGPFNWMNTLQDNKMDNDQQDDNNDNNLTVGPAYSFFKNQANSKNVDSDEMIKPEFFNWHPKFQPRFGMDRDLLGPRMHGRTEEARRAFGRLGDDDDDEETSDEKKDWKGPGGGSSEEQDNDDQVGRGEEDSMERGHGGRGGRGGRGGKGHRGKGKNCMCKKVTRILDEMKRKHRGGGKPGMFDDN